MNKRDILMAGLVIALLVVLFNRINSSSDLVLDGTPVLTNSSVEEELEDVLGIDIGDEGEKLELTSGGNLAVATRHDDGSISIIADLPDLEDGEYYEAVGLGMLTQAKGGYILNTTPGQVINEITIKRGDETILQGSF